MNIPDGTSPFTKSAAKFEEEPCPLYEELGMMRRRQTSAKELWLRGKPMIIYEISKSTGKIPMRFDDMNHDIVLSPSLSLYHIVVL
jgi:hypothetical protein